MRLAFLTNIPSPYRVDFFNELGKTCDLTVILEKGASDERDDTWKSFAAINFKAIVLSGFKVATDKAFSPAVKKYLKQDAFDHIIVCNTFTPTGMYAIRYMQVHNIPYWIEGDGAFLERRGVVKKAVKTRFIQGAKGYFSTSETHDQYYEEFGAERDIIYRYPFSSVRDENVLDKPIAVSEKKQIRDTLNICEKAVVLSVGQFVYRKGFDILLQASSNLASSIGIYIIGGTATKAMRNYVKKNDLSNVHFLPFQRPEKLRDYYKAADVFVLPTREDIWGLVVNEAMSCGIPVVTTEKCISGLEMVQDGVNGFIVPCENSQALSSAIAKILNEDKEKMSMAALQTARCYTIQNMAKTHMTILKSVE